MSSLTWLDYSEHERRKMLDVIHAFDNKDTRDELGIGSVRDAFADLFFPGTSTIQTRARYFLFIPWIYLDLERQKTKSKDIERALRNKEVALIFDLLKSSDKDGIIGKDKKDKLQRFPSNIYWQGLGDWGIRLYPGSQSQYHRSLDGYYSSTQRARRSDDQEPIDGPEASNWHPGIPSIPNGFPAKVTLQLNRSEAKYLQERILTNSPGTLLAFLVDRGKITGKCEFPWNHPQRAEFPEKILEQLEHAQNFADLMHGASLLYNFLLAEQTKSNEWKDYYQDELRKWLTSIRKRAKAFETWDRPKFWRIVRSANANLSSLTQRFVDMWIENALAQKKSMVSDDSARKMIYDREIFLKKGLARLGNLQRAQDLWNGEAGTARLNYRWSVAQSIINDILSGVNESTHA